MVRWISSETGMFQVASFFIGLMVSISMINLTLDGLSYPVRMFQKGAANDHNFLVLRLYCLQALWTASAQASAKIKRHYIIDFSNSYFTVQECCDTSKHSDVASYC